MTKCLRALILAGCLTLPALAGGKWEFLGERTVKLVSDKDTIHVTGVEGTFRKIKLAVKKNGVHFIDLKVHFANGQVYDVAMKSFIKAGHETRVIDLPGKARIIKKVVLRYKANSKNRKGRAVVRLWGRH